MSDYATLLKACGLKATFQRMIVLETIECDGHRSVEEIHEVLKESYPSISLATIYKNITMLQEKGILTEVPIVGRKSKYELSKSEHIHLVCTLCGGVEDHPYPPQSDEVLRPLIAKEQFALHKRDINLYGICHLCQVASAS